MQKSTVNNNPMCATSSATSSPPRRAPLNVGGPPKTGFNHTLFTNSHPSPLVSSASKTNGGNVDLPLRYLERRFDDGLGKILDQNTLVLEQMLEIKEYITDLADKVEHVAANQEQIREGRPVRQEVHQTCNSAVELAALKEQMDPQDSTPPTMISVASSVVDGSTRKKSEESNEPTFPPLNLPGKFSFADLAKNSNPVATFSFATTPSTQPFSGTGAPLFSSLSIADKSGENNNTSAHEEGEDDFVPTAEFKPVIPLPPLVEVKKGDENENTVAEYRAKLYRFTEETKEWKERGVGNIKLLQAKDNERKCRVVMWREKVGKLACNFALFPDIKVTNHQNDPNVLCWKCLDCTEELTWETFTLRFGNEDNCAHFKTEMERLAKMTVAAVEKSPSSIKTEPVAEEAPTTGGNKDVPLSQLFKKPEGSWNCEACYCTNGNDATACVACQTVRAIDELNISNCQTSRPGCEHAPKSSTAEAEIQQPTFSFGFPAADAATPTFNFGFGNTNNNTPVSSTAVEDATPNKQSEENVIPLKLGFAKNNGPPDTTFSFATTPTTTTAHSGSCPGCIGCNPDTYQIPEVGKPSDEQFLQLSLQNDSSNGPPSVVTLNLFTTSSSDDSSKTDPISSANVKLEPRGESSDSTDTKTESNNYFSNFSFQTPEKSTPTNSFQFKTPTFSFKSDDGNSSIFGAGGGGSIFTPPAGGHPPGTTPSPFVSPFAQQPSLLNNSSASPQSPVQSPNNESRGERTPKSSLLTNEDAPEEREEDDACEIPNKGSA